MRDTKWLLRSMLKPGTKGEAMLASYVKSIFESFKASRKPFERVWAECWRNFLGEYQQNLNWKAKTEGRGRRSRIFIKLTTLKCHTAHSKLIDVLFSGRGTVPFDVEAIDPEDYGITPEDARDAEVRAKERLKRHFKKIGLKKIMDLAILEMAILGTAVLKGPIIEIQKKPIVSQKSISGIPAHEIDASINPYEVSYTDEAVPVMDRVPLWEYYVDCNAASPDKSIAEMHFQRLLPAEFVKFAYQGGYDAEAVKEAVKRAGAPDTDETKCIQLSDNWTGESGIKDEKVSVLEYQGIVPVKLLRDAGVEVPESLGDEDYTEAVVTLAADDVVIRATINPIGRRQFFVCPYKERPGIIYGSGPAEAMRDSQKMINSAARLYIDNKALSANGMTAINLDRVNTKRTKDLDVYPGKTWYVKGNFTPRDVVDAVAFPDVTHGLREMIEMFERFADEETGLPKYTSGDTSSFLNKTATGMSMLMTQANVNLKTVIENIDDYWIEPIVEAFNDWFNEFEPSGGVSIPLQVKATGVDSLLAKEIKLENYMKFMQITAAPQDALFMDRVKMMKNIARLLETDDIMRSEEEIAQIMQDMTDKAGAPKDIREMVDLDRLFPLLTRKEQAQILVSLGIEPDMQGSVGASGQAGGNKTVTFKRDENGRITGAEVSEALGQPQGIAPTEEMING